MYFKVNYKPNSMKSKALEPKRSTSSKKCSKSSSFWQIDKVWSNNRRNMTKALTQHS